MTAHLRLLDLFACAGGAGVGYERAGFDVYAIDLDKNALKRNPHPSLCMDVLEALARLIAGEALPFTHRGGLVERLTLADFAAGHASPPCQAHSITKHTHDKEHPDLLEPTRAALKATGLPYVIENVVGAPLDHPLTLCGTEFGLTAVDLDGTLLELRRHRLFESNVMLWGAGGCKHGFYSPHVGGAYGGGPHDRAYAKKIRRGGYTPTVKVRAALLGIDWPMTEHQINQAIPPAYTEHVGQQLLEAGREWSEPAA